MEEEGVRAKIAGRPPSSSPFKPVRGLAGQWGQGGSDTSDDDGAETSSAASSDVFSLHGDQSKSSFQVVSLLRSLFFRRIFQLVFSCLVHMLGVVFTAPVLDCARRASSHTHLCISLEQVSRPLSRLFLVFL